MFYISLAIWAILIIVLVYKFMRAIRIVPQQKEYIVERLGNYHGTLQSGFHAMMPFIDEVAYIQDLREQTIDVPPQECFTKDNVKVEVDGVIYLQVMNSEKASYGVTNYRYGAIQLAQTTVRSIIGTLALDTTFEERDSINTRILVALSEACEPWGVKIKRYEVKNIEPPTSVKKAMEQQMSAERERRAMIFKAEGEKGRRINESEGLKMELVNKSEGEMQRCINEAEGRAKEIEAIANATAEAIEKVAGAIKEPGGEEAVQLQLTEQYLGKLGNIANRKTSVLLPADLTKMDDLLQAMGLTGALGGPS